MREYRRDNQNGQSREIGNIYSTHKTKKNKTKTQHNMRGTPPYTHALKQRKQDIHEPSYRKLEVKTHRTSFLCGNRNGHHNTELGK